MASLINGYLTNATFKKIISALTGAEYSPSGSEINGPVTEQAGLELLAGLENSGGILPPHTSEEVNNILMVQYKDTGDRDDPSSYAWVGVPIETAAEIFAANGFVLAPVPTAEEAGSVLTAGADGSVSWQSASAK